MTIVDAKPANTDDVLAGLKIIDSDTHFSEPHDLWTSRAPRSLRDRLMTVKSVDGVMMWHMDGVPLMGAGGSSFVNKQGEKISFYLQDIAAHGNMFDLIHEGSYDPVERVKFMDALGVHAHIIYPNMLGFSMGYLMTIDRDLAYAVVSIYNDAMGEFAATAPGRLFPQAVMPFWDIELSIKEAIRCREELGLSGIAMSGEPHLAGLPDLGKPEWDPFYEVISDLELPVNIHIASTAVAGPRAKPADPAWDSAPGRAKKAVRSVQYEIANSRFMSNIVVSDILHRWPKVKWVSVESGIGWIPFVLERVDYEYFEDFPGDPAPDLPSSLEMFRRNVYGTFWFEKAGPTLLLDYLGADNLMWESDFPHPTCLHPDALERSARMLAEVHPDAVRKVMQDNAAKLYKIPLTD